MIYWHSREQSANDSEGRIVLILSKIHFNIKGKQLWKKSNFKQKASVCWT